MRKNKKDKKIEKDSFVLINRYNPKDYHGSETPNFLLNYRSNHSRSDP